jgi:hypothetical protein
VVERAARMDAPRVGLDPPAMATLGIFLYTHTIYRCRDGELSWVELLGEIVNVIYMLERMTQAKRKYEVDVID